MAVPNVPGVPPLSSYASGGVSLLIADAQALGSILLPPRWGIYLDGVPVVSSLTPLSALAPVPVAALASIAASLVGGSSIVPVFASTIDFEFAQEWPLSNYPQEQGAFQSYDKVTLPYDVKVKVAAGGSAATRQAFLNTCFAIANSLALFDVVTPEIVYASANCTHMDFRREATRGVSLITVDLWFQNVSVSAAATFQNTQQPGFAGQQGLGNAQPQGLPLSVQSGIQQFAARGNAAAW